MNFLAQQVVAVARAEWRVTWRGLGLRLVMVLLAVPFIPYFLLPRTNFDDGGLHVLTFVAPLTGLLAAFLVVPGPLREVRSRVAELVWARPLDSLAYVAGKALAAVLIMAALLAELTALAALAQAMGGLPSGAQLLVNALLAVAPALLFWAALYVVLGALLPRPLPGYVLAILLTIVCVLYFTQSMLVLWNPWAVSLFYNKALGYGPDLPLLLANRLFYLGLTLALVGVAVTVWARRERRALAPRRQKPIALAIVACGLAVSVLAVPPFRSAVAARTLSGPVVAPVAAPLSVDNYRLDLRLDPTTGAEDGAADFSVRNTGATLVAALPVYLNDGLRIMAATVDGRMAVATYTPQFDHIALTPALAPGASAAIHLAYGGRFKVLHAEYGTTATGLQGPAGRTAGQYDSLFQKALHPSYLGEGAAALYRDGDWYPLPWTRGVTTLQPGPLGWRALTMRLPAAARAAASTTRARRLGDEQIFTWTVGGRLPMAVLAVAPARYARLDIPGGTVYAPDGDAQTLRARYGPYVTALRDLNSYFGHAPRHVAVVAMPLGGASGLSGSPVQAAAGDTLALVPMGGVDVPLYGAPAVTSLPAPAPYRAALADLAVAWWLNRLPSIAGPTRYSGQDDLPSGYVDVTERVGYNDTTGLAPAYTAMAVAERRLGATYYAREMGLRRALAAMAVHSPPNDAAHTLYNAEYLGQGPLGHEIRALGLMRRLDANVTPPDVSPALDDLRRTLGAERARALLVGLAAAGATPNDALSVGCALSRATGRPVTAWMNRYRPESYRITLTGGCR